MGAEKYALFNWSGVITWPCQDFLRMLLKNRSDETNVSHHVEKIPRKQGLVHSRENSTKWRRSAANSLLTFVIGSPKCGTLTVADESHFVSGDFSRIVIMQKLIASLTTARVLRKQCKSLSNYPKPFAQRLVA